MFRELMSSLAVLGAASSSFGQSSQRVAVPQSQGTMAAWFNLPQAALPVPAVVVAHGSGGLDGRSAPYIKALNAAGIATLEIEMFKPNQRPSRPRDSDPQALAALQYLAANPSVAPTRIGIMGMSWGGAVTLRMAEEKTYPRSSPLRYAALEGLYPTCWAFADGPAAKDGVLASPTGRPLLILAGSKDDYDAPDDCQKVVNRINAARPGTATLHVYPGATHQWDSTRGAMSFSDSAARRGRGVNVSVFPQPAVTQDAAARTAAFFVGSLGH
jgi:dienelactone hydrolase